MMVAEKATPRIPAEGRSEHEEHHLESITTCGVCDSVESLYIVGGGFLCEGCVALAVSMATDVWPNLVSYSKEFEAILL